MVANAFPGDDESGADGKLQRVVNSLDYFTGMGPLYGAQVLDGTPFGLTGGMQVYSSGAGLQVKVRTGIATVFGHQKVQTSEVTIPIPAATSGTRTDLIVLCLDLSPGKASLTFERRPGTSGRGGQPTRRMTPTVIWDLPLAFVTVAAGAASIPSVNIETLARPAPSLADHPRGVVAYSEDTDASHWSPATAANHVAARALVGAALRCTWRAELDRRYRVTFHAYRVDMLGVASTALPQSPMAIVRMIVKRGTTIAASDVEGGFQVNATGVPAEYGCDSDSGDLINLSGLVTAGITIESNDPDCQVQFACGSGYPAFLRVEDIGRGNGSDFASTSKET